MRRNSSTRTDAAAFALLDPDGPRQIRIVYTPMHGVGGQVVPELLAEAGFGPVSVVAAQEKPDPDFPTVAFPNPEEPGALDLALGDAVRLGADLVLANDPDADRLAIAVPDRVSGAWKRLTGDELGVLLGDHVLSAGSGADRLVATTIVSSTLLSAMAQAAGVSYVETLTGFKWIARAALRVLDPASSSVMRRRSVIRSATRCPTRTGCRRHCSPPRSWPAPRPRGGP